MMRQEVSEKIEQEDDKYRASKMTVKALKTELRTRQISTAGLKSVLVIWLVAALQMEEDSQDNDDMIDNDDTIVD